MNSTPVTIARIVRPMRGGSQARLVVGQDGHSYVAKFAGNPQGTRTLINEWIAYKILDLMGVSTPRLEILELPSGPPNEALYFSVGSQKIAPEGPLHLGSRCPVNPEKIAILDYLPARLFPKITNLADFAAMLAFDQFVAQTDSRQAIFVRDRSLVGGVGFRVYFIDHGMAFDGATWELRDAASPCGAYFRSEVYSYIIDLVGLVEKALCFLEAISGDTLLEILEEVPTAWFAPGDREALRKMLDELQRRQARIRSIVYKNLQALAFPATRTPGAPSTEDLDRNTDLQGNPDLSQICREEESRLRRSPFRLQSRHR